MGKYNKRNLDLISTIFGFLKTKGFTKLLSKESAIDKIEILK
jgi:hypothetical protein